MAIGGNVPFLSFGMGMFSWKAQMTSPPIFTPFYKELFLGEPPGGVSLCDDFCLLTAQVSEVENAELTLPFSPEEVDRAIASMKSCSAPGPDGLPVVYFQKFWEILCPIIMPMFHEFYIGTLDMARINIGVIALIPKAFGASDIRQFRLMTVINVLARIFAKAITHIRDANSGKPPPCYLVQIQGDGAPCPSRFRSGQCPVCPYSLRVAGALPLSPIAHLSSSSFLQGTTMAPLPWISASAPPQATSGPGTEPLSPDLLNPIVPAPLGLIPKPILHVLRPRT
ncbi:putative NOT transcription complex subunit VIP2 [Hordeum vulgare]|nr:putative NOT transcription complex subunit VIP2 [Hordeum vulgare]